MSEPPRQPLTHLTREVDQPAGTLVLLHGRATNEHDLFGLFDVLDPGRRLRGITVGAPLRLMSSHPPGKHWYVIRKVGFPDAVTFAHTLEQLGALLDAELGLDWATTVVGGFSQGCVMSYALGLGPDRARPAGILGLSGFVPTVEGWAIQEANARDLPVLHCHGTADSIISIDFARDARARLEAAGADLTYRETPMGHQIDPRALPKLTGWLAERP